MNFNQLPIAESATSREVGGVTRNNRDQRERSHGLEKPLATLPHFHLKFAIHWNGSNSADC